MLIPIWVFKMFGWIMLVALALLGVLLLAILWKLRKIDFRINW